MPFPRCFFAGDNGWGRAGQYWGVDMSGTNTNVRFRDIQKQSHQIESRGFLREEPGTNLESVIGNLIFGDLTHVALAWSYLITIKALTSAWLIFGEAIGHSGRRQQVKDASTMTNSGLPTLVSGLVRLGKAAVLRHLFLEPGTGNT